MLLSALVRDVLKGLSSTRVVGTVYQDDNSDGVRNNGENGVQGWRVYVDLDASGTYNQDALGDWEPSALTNADGDFSISKLLPGVYRVAEVVQPGWSPTATVSREVNVIRDKDNKTYFFNFAGGSIVGTVWNDYDGDGSRAFDTDSGQYTEPGLPGFTMFLDLDNDHELSPGDPQTVTDLWGQYRFDNLPQGDYEVYQEVPSGWEPTVGFDTHETAAVNPLGVTVQDFGDFGTSAGSLVGTLWNDLNFNGVRDFDPDTGEWTEPGLEGWTVFLDLDYSGTLDTGEPLAVSGKDGDYIFPAVLEGTYQVTQVLPDGWNVSDASSVAWSVDVFAGSTSVVPDFVNFTVLNGSVRGTVWNDRFRDGTRDIDLAGTYLDPGLAGWQVYLDLNRNLALDAGEPFATTDVNGQYLFTDLQVGDYELLEIIPAGWETTVGYGDNQTVTVYSGAETLAADFANFNLDTSVPGSISGTVWNDLNGNGVRETAAGGGYSDPGLSGRTVFADLNGDGVAGTGEPTTNTTADGSYTLTGVRPGTVSVIEVLPTGWTATTPTSGARTLSLRNGGTATGIDFGNYARQEGVLSGRVFNDRNSNGVRDTGEPGLAGLTVFLDTNDNGVLDAGEPSQATREDQFFTPAVDETGTWEFTHLAGGTYHVRVAVTDALSATPAAARVQTVTLSAAQVVSGLDTAARYRRNEILGLRFDDANANGVRDAGEAGVAGATIYLDVDRDDILDADEPRTITAADGSYHFSDLAPGSWVVRDIPGTGSDPTSPATGGGTQWPSGTSNPAQGNVTPTAIEVALAAGQSHRCDVSLTLPGSGALTNMVDVFLLFDDTGSFVGNSPIVRAAFPDIISTLQTSLPGVDLGFGVGRFEEYGNFAWEYGTGRPFILNQPIVAASTSGYLGAIQAALDRTTPGYGGGGP
ncbi:MAG: collagen binding domain-containing protein, partial [Planctomycetaceae bacterium]